jgi:hypothetical protein
MVYRTSIVDVPQRLTVKRIATEGILAYDIDNAYPQRVMDIIKGSGTAFRCNEIYAKFISGQGFADQSFYKAKVNQLGQTNDFILRKTANDLAMFRGFAFHVNYNANYQITDVYSIPFEHCRLAVEKDSYTPYAVAVYDDWNKRRLKQIKKENIDIINFFNPEKVEEEVIEAKPLPPIKGSFFNLAGGKNFQRPFELATLRLRNMTEVLSNWKTYVPNGAYLTQRGGTFLFDKNGKLLYKHQDKGILGFADQMNRPLSFLDK